MSRGKETAEQLKEAILLVDHEKMGRLFGIPETAVQAYVKAREEGREKELLFENLGEWWQSLPEEEKKSLTEEEKEIFDFLTFTLSRQHWEEELEVLRRRREVIKTKAPNLYEELRRGHFLDAQISWYNEKKMKEALKTI